MKLCRLLPALAGFALACPGLSFGQAVRLPTPDKDGWIKLFRADNGSDWYIANNGNNAPAKSKLAFPNGTFTRSGDTLKVTGNPGGQIYFNQAFSHYRVSYEMRFPGGTGNCGMLLHVQENDAPQNGFPVGLESQGDPNQGMAQLWCIGSVWVNVRATDQGSHSQKWRYDPQAAEIVTGGKSWASADREVDGIDGPRAPAYAAMSQATGWALQEAEVRGSDSIAHFVNGVVRIKYRDPRVSPGGTATNVTKRLSSGLVALQSEGTAVWYREVKIRLLPGDPLYTATYAEFDARNTIRPPAPRKVLVVKDGILGLRGPDGDQVFGISGRRLPGLRAARGD
jgi:hypothetical protein